MLEAYKQLVTRQFEASLCMVGSCMEQCPESAWDAPVCNLKFCQAVFHVLFFTDLYLDKSIESQREQPFHVARTDVFRDYEELIERKQQLMYDRPTMREYLQHCRTKSVVVLGNETEASLNEQAGFEWIRFNRAELHAYNIRHIQHHAAQLSLKLRMDCGKNIAWVGTGWRDV